MLGRTISVLDFPSTLERSQIGGGGGGGGLGTPCPVHVLYCMFAALGSALPFFVGFHRSDVAYSSISITVAIFLAAATCEGTSMKAGDPLIVLLIVGAYTVQQHAHNRRLYMCDAVGHARILAGRGWLGTL